MTIEPRVLSDAERRACLEQAIAGHVRDGARVEYQGEWSAVIAFEDRPNHVMHAILSVLTLGLWLFVWLVVSVTSGPPRRYELEVDEYGAVEIVDP